MNNDKQLIIYFNNGTKMVVSFPPQIKNSTGALVEGIKTLLAGEKLVVQTAEKLVIVPWSSIKYVDASVVPATALPFGVIKGARIVESSEGEPAA